MNKTLVVFVNPEFDRISLVNRLQALFKSTINIVGRSFDDYKPDETPALVLAGESTISKASEYYPNSRIVFISRTNSNLNIEKLIMLPTGTKVLVANEPRSAAVETINDIKSMGIDHLDLIPYWPGISEYDTNIDTVVYAGYQYHCPPGHSRYIDIGQRDINFSVTAAIIQEFHLPHTILDEVQADSNLRYVKAAYKINSYFSAAQAAKNSFETICRLSENILVVTDLEDHISYFNKSAEDFFKLNPSDVIGNRIYQAFSDYPSLLRLYTAPGDTNKHVTTLRKNRAIVNITKINGNPEMKAILSIIPASEIHKHDAQIRKEIKKSGFEAKYTFDHIIGESVQIKEAIQLAHHYAKSDASIFISGESGTGKELFAQSIHNLSERNGFPFVSVNCAALPDSLAESELFGYDDGAFTGASKGGKSGKFELAHCGTIFLDEIGDAPLNLQTKLLRVIEEQEVVRIGSDRVIPIDVRIICASNKDLKQMAQDGEFRQDLYYRINVLPLNIPALRDRKEDIPAISETLFDNIGMPDSALRRFFIQELSKCEWPGNVRELRSAVQLLATLSDISESHDSGEINEAYWHSIVEKHFTPNPKVQAEPKNLPDLRMLVLKTIERKSHEAISFGRGALLKDTVLNANGLTEYRLKKYIADFAEKGLISIGSTKQGMRITEKGIEYLTK